MLKIGQQNDARVTDTRGHVTALTFFPAAIHDRIPPVARTGFSSVVALLVEDQDATCSGPGRYQKVRYVIKKFCLE